MSDCLHAWVLDRPESDTWECLDCGAEGNGYTPAATPDPGPQQAPTSGGA